MTGEALYPFYQFLTYYYDGKFFTAEFEAFQQLVSALCEEATGEISEALEGLHSLNKEEFAAAKYDFSRLFVGPGKLKAPPYESSYRNEYAIVMQDETLSVRRAYLAQGLQLRKLNVEPDDHFALEFEFLTEMLRRGNQEAYARFLKEHVSFWLLPHCQCIRKNTTNQLCLSMAQLLTAVITQAENELSGDEIECKIN